MNRQPPPPEASFRIRSQCLLLTPPFQVCEVGGGGVMRSWVFVATLDKTSFFVLRCQAI